MSRNLQFVELFFIPKKFNTIVKHLDGKKTSDGKENNLVAHFPNKIKLVKDTRAFSIKKFGQEWQFSQISRIASGHQVGNI